ncbi:MAG: flavin reductase family protein [Acidimicrobiales bacterium]
MIDRDLKRCLGRLVEGVQVVAATHGGLTRAYCSHWVSQVSFDEPLVLASVSPRHDTHPLIVGAGWFSVSLLAGDQVEAGQYFSYPGHRFKYVADEHLATAPDGTPYVVGSIAWLRCEVVDRVAALGGHDGFAPLPLDHELVFARVTAVGEGRLDAPALLYSSRKGWRIEGDKARTAGDSVRDRLLARVAQADRGDGEAAAGSEPGS